MRVGTDIIEIERIRQAVERNPRFARKILTESEYARYEQYVDYRQMAFLAGRFCAKEAYVKALHTGIGKIKFVDISIGANEKGAPIIEKAPITNGVSVSISHTREYATATVIMEHSDQQLEEWLQQWDN